MKIPPYLKKGDSIGLVAPAGYMDPEAMHTCIETLDAWGYNVVMGETTHSHSATYFSGTDEERCNDLQQMMDDKKIAAILCARGGYGISRIIDQLNFKRFRKHPKWIVGFSDVTVLHAHLHTTYNIASLHAPMAKAFADGGADSYSIQSLRKALEGEPATYKTGGHEFNKVGTAEGELVGGNLALLTHLVGTDSDLRTKNKILFLEDVGEYLYNIDRMLLQLKRAGKFDKLAALVIGGFTDTKDTERPFGKNVNEIIYEHVKEFDYPVCFGFPVSHEAENVAVKIGVEYKLDVMGDSVVLQETEVSA